jgi:hypothetical protein
MELEAEHSNAKQSSQKVAGVAFVPAARLVKSTELPFNMM